MGLGVFLVFLCSSAPLELLAELGTTGGMQGAELNKVKGLI